MSAAPVAAPDARAARAPVALRVALGEYDTGWHDPEGSLARAADVIARAAGEGARLVLLPEMCTTGFTMDAERWAEPLDGPSATRLAELAARHRVWLIAGLAAREGTSAPFNAAAVFDDAGALRATYRKQRLFAHGGEHASYAPGDAPVIVEIDGVRVSPFICYDLRFPELFRAVARDVDAIALIASWPVARRAHWDALVRARAIENLCYVAAVNRVGEAGGIAYDGGSIVYGPWGDVLASPASGTGVAMAAIEPAVVRGTRERYRFLDDMEG